MSRYRRVWVPGSTYLFTVNLLERRRTLLTKKTKKAREDLRIAGDKIEQIKEWLSDLNRNEVIRHAWLHRRGYFYAREERCQRHFRRTKKAAHCAGFLLSIERYGDELASMESSTCAMARCLAIGNASICSSCRRIFFCGPRFFGATAAEISEPE